MATLTCVPSHIYAYGFRSLRACVLFFRALRTHMIRRRRCASWRLKGPDRQQLKLNILEKKNFSFLSKRLSFSCAPSVSRAQLPNFHCLKTRAEVFFPPDSAIFTRAIEETTRFLQNSRFSLRKRAFSVQKRTVIQENGEFMKNTVFLKKTYVFASKTDRYSGERKISEKDYFFPRKITFSLPKPTVYSGERIIS